MKVSELAELMEERLDVMQEEINSLRAHIDKTFDTPQIQYVRELKPMGPISKPIDFTAMNDDLAWQHANYDESVDYYDDTSVSWSYNGYL